MKLDYLNSIVLSFGNIIKGILKIDLKKGRIEMSVGKVMSGYATLVYKISGDVNCAIYCDISEQLTKKIFEVLIGSAPEELSEKILNHPTSPIKKIGKTLMTALEKAMSTQGYKAIVAEPLIFVNSGRASIPEDLKIIVMGMLSDFGGFTLNIVDTKESFFNGNRLLFFNPTMDVLEISAFNFLCRGFMLLSTNDPEHWYKIFQSYEPHFIFFDSDTCSDIKEFINDDRKFKLQYRPASILYKGQANHDLEDILFRRSLYLGEILRGGGESLFIYAFKSLVSREGLKGNERRKFVRITLSHKDYSKLNFVHPEDEDIYIRGQVLNIGMGGMAFTVEEPKYLESIKLKSVIKDLNINVLNNFIVADAEVIFKKGKAIGVKFTRITSKFEKTLSELIIQKRGRVEVDKEPQLKM